MGIFGFIEDNMNEAECFVFGHNYGKDGVCENCGRKER